MTNHEFISSRELEILELVATGASNKDIAGQLEISVNTVKVHLQNIFKKLKVNTRTEAALLAVHNGYFDAQDSEYGEIIKAKSQRKWATITEGDRSTLAAKRSSSWTLSLALVGIVLLGLVGMFIVLQLDGDGTGVGSPDRFPVESERWQPLANLPTPRSDLTVVTYEDNIFAIGGLAQNQASGALERYDPSTNSWYSLINKPLGVYGAKAAVIGGLIYVPGGETAPGQPTNVVEVYDPREQVWLTTATMPVQLSRYAMVAFEGKLYIFGGWDGLEYRDTVYSFNPQTNSWSEHSSMPTARGYAGAAVAGGSIYVIGGFDGERALSVNEAYAPNDDAGSNQAWNVKSPLPSPRFAMGTSSIAEIIYIVGGEGSERAIDILEYFHLTDEWRSEGIQLKQPWSRLGLTYLGTDLYAIGGITEDLPSSLAMRFKAIYVVNLPLVQ
jgi:DNA-binding CsgD family transcriptional regulator/N-acetylneuraminic acid mutarotase